MTSYPRRLHRAGAGIAFVLIGMGAVTAGCGARYVRATTAPGAASGLPEASVTRHVVVVSIDGLRPDAIARFNAPTLTRLLREGSYSLTASTILPSKTLPSHTSMLTGEPPEQHHVLWNNVATAESEFVGVPTIFGVARARGYRTAAFFSKPKFHPLQKPETLDYSQAPGGLFGRWWSNRTIGDVEAYLAEAKPNLLFVHLPDPDARGHASGWMSEEYGRGVRDADAALARLIVAADAAFGAGRYSLIVTADHGGHDFDHGSDDPRDTTIPWIAWGQGVKPGTIGDAVVRTMDTASTALWLLGLDEPTEWFGSVVTSAFASAPAVAGGAGSQSQSP
jgi:arylsulfatase A-like enzyme